MFEILFLALPAIVGLGALARKRGLSAATASVVTMAAAGGFVLFIFLGGLVGFLARWVWLGLGYVLLLVLTRRSGTSGSSWQCPACLGWNEPSAYYCLCGTENPEFQPADDS